MAYSPIKDNARSKVAHALRTGKLARPSSCDECLKPGPQSSDGRATIHAHHHKGYEFPLHVTWLCPSCHFQKDKRPSREANGRAKLDSETVSVIRTRYTPAASGGSRYRQASPTSMKSLANEFGVSLATISRIVNNKNWIDETMHGAGNF